MSDNTYNLLVILGPTATGKTRLAAKLAYEFNGEIISADSRQVYRRMDIGTGKDLDDYIVNHKKIPYHLIDIIEPDEEFNLFLFKNYFNKAFEDITQRGNLPVLAGGTGLYLNAILQNYDLLKADFNEIKIKKLKELDIERLQEILISLNPSLHNTTDLKEKERIIKAIIIQKANQTPVSGKHIIKPLV
ncbi:MAG: isopentenyl transferase family protein, partial [Ignavibacteriaceae bacterium]